MRGLFNRFSRAFIDAGGAEGRSLTDIGADFADWLRDPAAADLARDEWASLESYNAVDASALGLADLAGCDKATLFGMTVRLHPAARTLSVATNAAPLVRPALRRGRMALLITRPAADVQLSPTDAAAAVVLDLAKEISPLGNLLLRLAEDHPDGGAALAGLIDAGAFERL